MSFLSLTRPSVKQAVQGHWLHKYGHVNTYVIPRTRFVGLVFCSLYICFVPSVDGLLSENPASLSLQVNIAPSDATSAPLPALSHTRKEPPPAPPQSPPTHNPLVHTLDPLRAAGCNHAVKNRSPRPPLSLPPPRGAPRAGGGRGVSEGGGLVHARAYLELGLGGGEARSDALVDQVARGGGPIERLEPGRCNFRPHPILSLHRRRSHVRRALLAKGGQRGRRELSHTVSTSREEPPPTSGSHRTPPTHTQPQPTPPAEGKALREPLLWAHTEPGAEGAPAPSTRRPRRSAQAPSATQRAHTPPPRHARTE